MTGRAAGWLAGAACAGAAGAVGVTLAVACIPDLPAQPASPGDDADTIVGCGDGITDLDAGEQCDPGQVLPGDATFAGCGADCKMACDGGFVWSRNNHCYFKAAIKKPTELQASFLCTERAHIVTFASEEEFETVAGTVDAGPFWVGLVANPVAQNEYTAQALFEPGWSPTCSGCFAHVDEAGAPLPGSTQACVEAFSYLDASWRQYPCNNTGTGIYVVCEREPWSSTARRCDGGVCFEIPATRGAKRYLYALAKSTADDAAKRCAALGGSLVVLQSSEEREQIWYELSRLPGTLSVSDTTQLWIGLTLGDGGWVWDDGTSADAYPSPWADQAPDPLSDAARAYLTETPAGQFDTTLADNHLAATATISFLCQFTAGAPDAGDAGDAGEAGPGDASDAGSPD